MFRRTRRFLARHQGRCLLYLSAVVALGMLPWPEPPVAKADEDVETLEKTALSDLGLNQRLIAVESLRKKGGSAALDALADIAAEGDLPVACAATAALGREGTGDSKAELKSLLQSTSLRTNVRIAAASAIAEHWRDEDDLDYLEEKSEGNEDLEAHCSVLRTRVYGKEE